MPRLSDSLLALESRIMFDGAAVTTVSTVATEQAAQSQANLSLSGHDASTDNAPAAPTGEPQSTNGDQALFDALAAYDPSAARQEIVFLSPSVLDYQKLLDGISPNVEVIVLDPARDGVEQMAETLAGRTDIDAIHIISHGAQAELTLGNARLTLESMNGVYANELEVIGQSLSEKADLLIYGCNFGQGESGAEAAMRLGQLTSADVAASTDDTGHAFLGGDWDLEHTVGPVETSQLFTTDVQQDWSHLMATETIIDNFDVAAYNNNNGTQSWSTDWVETDNGGGGAGGGNILVTGNALLIDMGLGTIGNKIYREVDLTGALSATLTYSHIASLGVGGSIEVQISADGGANYTTLKTYSTLPSSGSENFDITAYISANTRVRFEVTGALLLNTFQFDAVQISYVTNDPPVITNLAGDSLIYNKGAGAIVIEQGGNATVSDANSVNFDTGALTVSFTAGSDVAEDVLAIRNQGTGAGQIGVSGSTVTYGGTTIGSFTGGSGGTPLVVTFNSAATPVAAQALIQNITYENTDTAAPTTGARTVRFVLTDGDGGNSGNHNTTVTVNYAPVNTVPGAQTVNEDTPLPLSGVTVTDVDGNLSTVQLDVLNGTVNVTVSGTATITAGANDTNMLTLSGSQTDIVATLASLVYQGTLNYGGPDTLTITSIDTGSAIDLDTVTITVNPVNDAPVITSDGGGATARVNVDENQNRATTVTETDVDGGSPTYTIVGGADAGLFTLDATTGALTFDTAPDFEAPGDADADNVYDVTVQIDDGNGGKDTQVLSIMVNDVLEGLPPITPPSPTPPNTGLPQPLPPIVGGPPISPPPGPGTPFVPVGPDNGPGGIAPPPLTAGVVAAKDVNTPVSSVPLGREPLGYLEERVAPLIDQTGEEVQMVFDKRTVREGPAQLAKAFEKTLNVVGEELRQATDMSESHRQFVIRVTNIGGITLTAGLITWLLQSGALLASLTATLPAWRHFDPLPVVLVGDRERRKRKADTAAAAEHENKQFRGLKDLVDRKGERSGGGGRAA